MAGVTKMPQQSSITPHLKSKLFLSGENTENKFKSLLKIFKALTNVLLLEIEQVSR